MLKASPLVHTISGECSRIKTNVHMLLGAFLHFSCFYSQPGFWHRLHAVLLLKRSSPETLEDAVKWYCASRATQRHHTPACRISFLIDRVIEIRNSSPQDVLPLLDLDGRWSDQEATWPAEMERIRSTLVEDHMGQTARTEGAQTASTEETPADSVHVPVNMSKPLLPHIATQSNSPQDTTVPARHSTSSRPGIKIMPGEVAEEDPENEDYRCDSSPGRADKPQGSVCRLLFRPRPHSISHDPVHVSGRDNSAISPDYVIQDWIGNEDGEEFGLGCKRKKSWSPIKVSSKKHKVNPEIDDTGNHRHIRLHIDPASTDKENCASKDNPTEPTNAAERVSLETVPAADASRCTKATAKETALQVQDASNDAVTRCHTGPALSEGHSLTQLGTQCQALVSTVKDICEKQGDFERKIEECLTASRWDERFLQLECHLQRIDAVEAQLQSIESREALGQEAHMPTSNNAPCAAPADHRAGEKQTQCSSSQELANFFRDVGESVDQLRSKIRSMVRQQEDTDDGWKKMLHLGEVLWALDSAADKAKKGAQSM